MLKRRMAGVALFLTLALCFFCSCTALQNTGGETVVFTDGTGSRVEAPLKPKKVAVLFSSLAEIWKLAGGSVAVTVGETVERGFAQEGTPLVDGGAGKSVDVELLLGYRPDFVIGSSDIAAHVGVAATLSRLKIPCALFRVEYFSDYLKTLELCTRITGDAQAYSIYGESQKGKIDALIAKIPTRETQKKVLFIRSGSGASSCKAKNGAQHFAAAMLTELKAYNIAENAAVLLDGLSIEEVLRENPEQIFISTMGNEDAAKAYMNGVLNSKPWQSVCAVQNNACHYLPKDLFQFKPNVRWYEAYRYLSELLYPELAV